MCPWKSTDIYQLQTLNITNCKLFNCNKDHILQSTRISMIFLVICTFILKSIGVTLVYDENKLVFAHKIFLSTLSTFEHNQEFLQDHIKKPTWSDNLYLIILDMSLEVNCHLSVTKIEYN